MSWVFWTRCLGKRSMNSMLSKSQKWFTSQISFTCIWSEKKNHPNTFISADNIVISSQPSLFILSPRLRHHLDHFRTSLIWSFRNVKGRSVYTDFKMKSFSFRLRSCHSFNVMQVWTINFRKKHAIFSADTSTSVRQRGTGTLTDRLFICV